MKELLNAYSNEGEKVGQIEKKEFHKKLQNEYLKTKTTTIRHKCVRLLLLNSSGKIILQKRSKWKADNAGKWDKTVGGHVREDDSYDLTMLKECAEELGLPATIVKKNEFETATQTTNLQILGILTKLSYLDNCQSTRQLKNGKKWIETSMVNFYMGYYDGAIRFIDKEACGIQIFSLEELKQEIKEQPENFTDDIKFILKKFKNKIKPITNKREHTLND
jgi:isopentenyl-diphosphate Delta-isomerase